MIPPKGLYLHYSRTKIVEQLPRRTAHALHGLIVATAELKMPVTAAEAQIYDEEAVTAQQTAAGLRHARKLGLAIYTGLYWTTTFDGSDLKYALEDRYLRETEDGL